ncbi:zinc finger CCCH domain-containing protein 34-like [Tripterygium wilfordii]|uniref:zinc finger CCCH domain-containing protein 34-like n=1 Tax=Tripterygium wilfordii TaxID=458696 RepID=UPI0018F83C71|nr:zinc finger CCCH domain-containing protein 34-like [Tripterygium wilfordii]
MEKYGRARRVRNRIRPWSGAETGLEEPMWRLGLSSCSGPSGGGRDGGQFGYPERPDEADCIYYLRTGFCGYGSWCRFNHPRDNDSGSCKSWWRGVSTVNGSACVPQ